MVIYYSSTGNSEHVALRLQKEFKGDLIDARTFNKSRQFHLKYDETLFFVTFNCFWGILKKYFGIEYINSLYYNIL